MTLALWRIEIGERRKIEGEGWGKEVIRVARRQ